MNGALGYGWVWPEGAEEASGAPERPSLEPDGCVWISPLPELPGQIATRPVAML